MMKSIVYLELPNAGRLTHRVSCSAKALTVVRTSRGARLAIETPSGPDAARLPQCNLEVLGVYAYEHFEADMFYYVGSIDHGRRGMLHVYVRLERPDAGPRAEPKPGRTVSAGHLALRRSLVSA